MYSKSLAFLALVPLVLAQSDTTPKPSAAEVVTMMWDNEPTAAAVVATSGSSMTSGMSGMSMSTSMTMSSEMSGMSGMSGMNGMSGMSMTSATGSATGGMNMTGSAGRTELMSGAFGAGWIVIGLGAGIGFFAGML